MGQTESLAPATVLGRYSLHGVIAAGGMATVHYGRLLGPVGFARTVAIKRLHPQCASDPAFVSMFLDEARLVARIAHPNVIPTLDVVATEGELFLVMEYVQGESLGRLLRVARRSGQRPAPAVVATIMTGVLHGLHAAHEATNERGEPLNIVHRDVSPQNILVGIDGVARVLDFGIAKAIGRAHVTRDGSVRGKLAYMSPEQVGGETVGRAADIFAAAIILWEALAGDRLFSGDTEAQTALRVLAAEIEPPSKHAPAVPPELDAVVLKALDRDPTKRFQTAREMARAIERTGIVAPVSDIGEWVEECAAGNLSARAATVAKIESNSFTVAAPDSARNLAQANERSRSSPDLTPLTPGVVRDDVSSTPDATFSTIPAPSEVSNATRRTRAVIVVGVVALSLLGAAFIGVAVRSGPAPPTSASSGALPVASPSAIPAKEPAEPFDPPATPASASEVTPSPESTAGTPPASSASAAEPVKTAPVKTAPVKTAPVKTAPIRRPVNCTPPYTVDAQGTRHYKKACLR